MKHGDSPGTRGVIKYICGAAANLTANMDLNFTMDETGRTYICTRIRWSVELLLTIPGSLPRQATTCIYHTLPILLAHILAKYRVRVRESWFYDYTNDESFRLRRKEVFIDGNIYKYHAIVWKIVKICGNCEKVQLYAVYLSWYGNSYYISLLISKRQSFSSHITGKILPKRK